jgi:hypothetical protein
LIILPFYTLAQHELWVGGGTELGVPFGTHYQNNKSIVYSRFGLVAGGSFVVQYRILQKLGIEVGAQQFFSGHYFRDRKFRQEHQNRFDANFNLRNFFTGFQFSIQYNHPIEGSYAGFYAAGGYKINNIGYKNLSKRGTFEPDNTVLHFNAVFNGTNYSLFSEIGTQVLTDDDYNLLTFALHYELGFKNVFEGTLHAERANEFIYKDRIIWKGSYFGILIKYHFKMIEIKGKYKKNEFINNTPITYKIRTTVVKDTIPVKTKKVKITIVEFYREDNDIISIQLNSRYVLQNHLVGKKPFSFEIELYPGKNELLFIAENLGNIPPNTATIFVEDEGKKYKIDFMGNLEKNEAIIIDYQPNVNKK